MGFEDDFSSIVLVLVVVFEDIVFAGWVLGNVADFLVEFFAGDAGGLDDFLLDEFLGLVGGLLVRGSRGGG